MRSLPIVLLLLSSLASAQTHRSASLDGAQVQTASTATGWATIRIDATNLARLDVVVNGAGGANGCALRHGAIGQSGATIVAFGGGPVHFGATVQLTAADASAVGNGSTHVVVVSAAFPAGEIRGQVRPARATRFQVWMLPGSLVPPRTGSQYGSIDAMYLYEPDDRLVFWGGEAHGYANEQGFEIRVGQTGQNGPLVDFVPMDGSTRKLTAAELTALAAGDLYVQAIAPIINVPTPVMRGQITPVLAGYGTLLDDSEVVPAVVTGVDSTGGCFPITSNTVAMNPNAWRFWVTRRDWSETACHVRRGARGTNGPIVFSLPTVGAPDTKWRVDRQLSTAERAELASGLWYFELVSNGFPGGVCRGQIESIADPGEPFGGGCPDGSGNIWDLVLTQGIPVLGAATSHAECVLHLSSNGPRPLGAFSYLVAGFQRTSSGGAPLPLRLDTFGLGPRCFLLVEAAIVAGSTGLLEHQFSLPTDAAFRGLGMFVQGALFDPAATGFVAVTHALALTLQ